MIVTGANSGLGSAIADQIASKAELSTYHGIYTVRDTEHAPALASALEHGTKIRTRSCPRSACILSSDSLLWPTSSASSRKNSPMNKIISNARDTHPVPPTPEMPPREPSTTCGTRPSSLTQPASTPSRGGPGAWSPATRRPELPRRLPPVRPVEVLPGHDAARAAGAPSRICVLGVKPGTMSSGLQRLALWVIRGDSCGALWGYLSACGVLQSWH